MPCCQRNIPLMILDACNRRFDKNKQTLTIRYFNLYRSSLFCTILSEIDNRMVLKHEIWVINHNQPTSNINTCVVVKDCCAVSTDYYSGFNPAVRALSVNTLTLNNVSITNNDMTGLWAFDVVVSRNSSTVFHNNTGIDVGGGLIMIDDSYLVFEDHSIINFTQNSAEKGGAI